MSTTRWKTLFLSCMVSLDLGWAAAQAQQPNAASGRPEGRLRMVVILSRHGVRSPTWTQARLDSYAAQPWPKWSVAPGNLTARGYELMTRFGSFDRASLAANGLLVATGCADAATTYIWADTDQRTMESGRALAEGLFPSCPPSVHTIGSDEGDPLFHPARSAAKSAETTSAADAQPPVDAEEAALLDQMQHVLLGCAPKVSCLPANPPASLLLKAAESQDNRSRALQAALAPASSFAEDFLLEYADGMPMDQVGWGQVNEAQLLQFLALHSDYFNLIHRTPSIAKLEASNLLYHIERTLQQRVEGQPLAGAIGPADSKVVLLVGHDTNIASIAALLGLHWKLDGRADDTPPGTELAFEVWQDNRGRYSIRATVSMQTLEQMRIAQDLTPASPPARERLSVPGCKGGMSACAWADFRRISETAIDNNDVLLIEPN